MIDGALDWWDTALRLLAAAGLGGLIGLERELDGQDAGFRTHMLLSLGAGLFGAASVGAFHDFVAERASTNVTIDVTRIASYVAAGVGFIGGGAIIKHAGVVKGITTASSLWAAAAIGLAAGLGFWAGAVLATGAALVALAVLRPISTMVARRQMKKAANLFVNASADVDVAAVLAVLRDHHAPVQTVHMAGAVAEGQEIQVTFWPPGIGDPDDLVAAVSAIPAVHSVQVDRRSGG